MVYSNRGGKSQYSHSVEKNLKIADAEKAHELLKALGFRLHAVVDKEREFFEHRQFIITLDTVKNLGIFAEIEWKTKEAEET